MQLICMHIINDAAWRSVNKIMVIEWIQNKAGIEF